MCQNKLFSLLLSLSCPAAFPPFRCFMEHSTSCKVNGESNTSTSQMYPE